MLFRLVLLSIMVLTFSACDKGDEVVVVSNDVDLPPPNVPAEFRDSPLQMTDLTLPADVPALFADRPRTLVFRDLRFAVDDESVTAYMIRFDVEHTTVLIDVDLDNSVDAILRKWPDGRISVQELREIARLRECQETFEESGDLSGLYACITGTSDTHAETIGGYPFASIIEEFENPDCNADFASKVAQRRRSSRSAWDQYRNRDHRTTPVPNLGVYRVRSLVQVERALNYEARLLEGSSEASRARGDVELANAQAEYARSMRELSDAVTSYRKSATPQEGLAAQREHDRLYREFERARSDYHRKVLGGGDPVPDPTRGNAYAVEDPRCAGQRVDASRGTLFSNRRFCRDRNFLACVERAESAIFSATGGRCRRVIGPDDAVHIVCGEEDDGGVDGDRRPGGGGSPGGGTDVDVTDPTAPLARDQISEGFLGNSEIGRRLDALCASGGGLCPEDFRN